MDELVARSLAKWPNVPAVYGWLALDRRGNWRIKGQRISNVALREFIARNYECDSQGRWFFQNGPQRSEEHTSELQSRLHLVCRLLLEKKNSHKDRCIGLMTSISELQRSAAKEHECGLGVAEW